MAHGAPIPALDDVDGDALPAAEQTGGEVVDAHVHLFPPRVFEAIWRWFDRHAWSVRYRLRAEEVVEFLARRGVHKLVALHYAHVPGMARELNRFAHEIARAHRDIVIPLGTVLPGEPDAREIVREALGPLGLHGLKLHCHVQKLAADDPRLDAVYEECQAAGKPVLIHCGREPYSPAYGFDTRANLGVAQMDRVLRRFPRLKVIVPHLGFDEFEAYAALLSEHEGLYLDTTMAVAGFFPGEVPNGVVRAHATRLLYGTDFPNLPYAWDREIKRLIDEPLSVEERRALFSGNARALFAC
jgi:predicted TIM-barrel fold metal-dependent hydrolase